MSKLILCLVYILDLGRMLGMTSRVDSVNLSFTVLLFSAFVYFKFGVDLRPYCSFSPYLQPPFSTSCVLCNSTAVLLDQVDPAAILISCWIIRGR